LMRPNEDRHELVRRGAVQAAMVARFSQSVSAAGHAASMQRSRNQFRIRRP